MQSVKNNYYHIVVILGVNKRSMKLSVLVPAYNLQDYISECLLSVLQQDTNFEYEVIVCDDASPDHTKNKIEQLALYYPVKLKSIFKSVNAGLAANMQTLLARATGEYIAYLDGDDVALPGKLQQQVDHLDNHHDCHMVFHESDMFDSHTKQTIKLYSKAFYNWSYIPPRSTVEHMILYGTYMQASSVMFRRHEQLLETVAKDCEIIFDYPFYINNAGYLNANVDFIPQVLGRYRIHPDSFGGQTSRSFSRRERSLTDIENACRGAKYFGIADEVIERGIAHHRFAAALYFLQRSENLLFRKYIELSACTDSFFDAKHNNVWQLRNDPKALSVLLERVV
ncbi:MAG: glycosyltransferase involved in cell wall biosynthesis [Paraglaciecola sp.]|jgi:glycosyltransferase involved in cell wall biosynthesis